MKPALFLDRDGVINEDSGYTHRIEDFRFIPGIFDLCRAARAAGRSLFVVTNQAGIGRGFYTEDDFKALTAWMCERFDAEGAPLDRVYFCPHHAEAGVGTYRRESDFRKPNPGMILQARDEFGLDLGASVLIGDKGSDIEAGIRAQVGTNLFFSPAGMADGDATPPAATAVITSLLEALPWVRTTRS
jgi:D-glycero-D-manno-heptose 1,7-bisphosphate phosphatase